MIDSLYRCFQHWSAKGSVLIYSDPHFDDDDIKNNFENIPSSDEQIKKINSKVGKNDTIIFLGDIGNVEYIKKIRGYKVLIKGNHDTGTSNYEEYFNEIYSGPLMISEKIILSHEPLNIDWAFNLHGHTHSLKENFKGHWCFCSNVINHIPISLADIIKSGRLKEIETIHRTTIDKATEKKKKRVKNE